MEGAISFIDRPGYRAMAKLCLLEALRDRLVGRQLLCLAHVDVRRAGERFARSAVGRMLAAAWAVCAALALPLSAAYSLLAILPLRSPSESSRLTTCVRLPTQSPRGGRPALVRPQRGDGPRTPSTPRPPTSTPTPSSPCPRVAGCVVTFLTLDWHFFEGFSCP